MGIHAVSGLRRSSRRLLALCTASLVLVPMGQVPQSSAVAGTSSSAGYGATVGVSDTSEPSGVAPPLATALKGYAQSYVTDFTGSTLPSGWSKFNGVPGGDPGTRFTPSQVAVGNGELQLNAAHPSSAHEWVTGGTCQCALSQTYGAYFVRSRLTGPGPTVVELLWPAGGHPWPPEVDFNETSGGTSSTMATVHYGADNQVDHRLTRIDMTQWHTWGVIWSPTAITYLVDGHVWGVVAASGEIPQAPMTLDIQQQTWCSTGSACPTNSQSTLVDWATEYKPATLTPVKVAAPLTTIPISVGLSPPKLSSAVHGVAVTVYRHRAHTVIVSASAAQRHRKGPLSEATRVKTVKWLLEHDLHSLGGSTPHIFVRWSNSAASSNAPLKFLVTLWP